MKYYKSQKEVKKSVIQNILGLAFVNFILIASAISKSDPKIDFIITISCILIAVNAFIIFSYYKELQKDKSCNLSVENQNLIFSGDGPETKINLHNISHIIIGIRKGKTLFIRIKSPDLGWITFDKFENLEELLKSILKNAINAKVRTKQKMLFQISKY